MIYPCPVCGKEFDSGHRLYSHITGSSPYDENHDFGGTIPGLLELVIENAEA